jgi:hypothetical protein
MTSVRIHDQAAAALRARRSPLVRACWTVTLFAAATLSALAVSLAQGSATFTPRDEAPEEYPPGPGREETFYTCTPCHNFKLVAQQGMNRRQWDESLAWMTEKHGMPALDGEERKLVLDYLEKTFPPSTAPVHGRGSPNPFLNR